MQLVMRLWDFEVMKGDRPVMPMGYHLRIATPEDAPALANLLSSCFEDEWNPELAHERFFEDPSVQKTFVIEADRRLVATASSQLLPQQWPDSGIVHWVGASPAHAGRGLGRVVTSAVLEDHRQRGCKHATLNTDDHRLAAIKTYLNLGFVPLMCHESHPERWVQVFRTLGMPICKRSGVRDESRALGAPLECATKVAL